MLAFFSVLGYNINESSLYYRAFLHFATCSKVKSFTTGKKSPKFGLRHELEECSHTEEELLVGDVHCNITSDKI